jgi:hypothetical protein
MFRSEPKSDFCYERPTNMVILGVEQPSVTDLESNIDSMDPALERKKKTRGKKDKKKKRKTKKHSSVSKNSSTITLKEDSMPMGIVEEVARVLKIYDTSDDEKVSHPRSSRKRYTNRTPSVGSEGLPIPSKSVLKRPTRDWNSPSLDQFFHEEHQFEGWTHQRKNTISKLEELEIRSQASKGSRFSSFLEENKTVREILNHLFDKELRHSTSQRIRQRFSIKALEEEELPCIGDNNTIFGDGRSLGGMESLGNQSMPIIGLNYDTTSKMSWFQRRRMSLLTSTTAFKPPPIPTPIPKQVVKDKIDISGTETQKVRNEAFGEKFLTTNSVEHKQVIRAGNSQSNHQSVSTRPNQRSSISNVFAIMSFSNLNEESIEPRVSTSRRPSLFGIRLDNAVTDNLVKENQDSVSKHDTINHPREKELKLPNIERRCAQSPSNEIVELNTPKSLESKESTTQESKAQNYEIKVEESPENFDELEGIIDDDVLLDKYIEELVAKEISNHESLRDRNISSNFSDLKDGESCGSSSDQRRGSDYVIQISHKREENRNFMTDEDEDQDEKGDPLKLLELLKDNLDKAPRNQKDLNGWFERNTDRKKILSSVEDRSHYGEIESVAGYSLQESLHSRRSIMLPRGLKHENDLLSVDELSHIDDYSDGLRRESSRRSYSDRSYSDGSYSDESYSDHSSDRSYSDKNSFPIENVDTEREGSIEGCNSNSISHEYSDDVHLSSVEDNDHDKGDKFHRYIRDFRDANYDTNRFEIQATPGSDIRASHESNLHVDVMQSKLTTNNAVPNAIVSNEGDETINLIPSMPEIESQVTLVPKSDESNLAFVNVDPLTIINNKELETILRGKISQPMEIKTVEKKPYVQVASLNDTNEVKEPMVNFDSERFQPREIKVVDEKPLELKLDVPLSEDENAERFKDFPRHDGTAFFRYRLQEWKESVEGGKCRAVTFDKVIIREHNLCPGDNPACSDALPISLDWDHGPIRVWAIDDFEKVKYMFPIPEDAEGMARRLSWTERRDLLIEVGGYSDREIKLAEKAHSKMLEEDRKQLDQGKNSNPGFFSRLFSSKVSRSQSIPEDENALE